ncbi:MAG: LD-carboxypeptidase [Candidatus Gastranaerophilales bacterium]|nr:LD-carboxypeptidase [Candidatus Gastranaerophilales bacterium]
MKKIKTIALVAPSGDIRNLDEINKKISILEEKFLIKKYYDENIKNGYLSDSDENRAKYFQKAFLDDEVDLVLALRGGYGTIRIVDKIDYELIKNSGKIYCGSSDSTILLAALNNKTNIKCFHSLMVSNGFVENLEKNIKIIENDIFNINLKSLKKGIAKGILWGGNLSSLVSLFSDDFYLPQEDIILFVEDLNEPMYKIDKMLYEIYRNKDLKSKIKGIIFGDFYFDESEILSLLCEYSDKFEVPSWLTFDITHKENNVTIPYGKFIKLN